MSNNGDYLEIEGQIIKVLGNEKFKVKLDQGHELSAHVTGSMKMNRINIQLHDRVRVKMNNYDITKGIIIKRL